ncbi:MAG: membrane dipeptidase [Phycisphaerae bacterium]|nr:membrane dipeptidase [Phycisphaerae bacterium]
MRWFDAHLDLACLAVNGRDMEAPPERAGGPWQPASVTLPSLAAGGVTHALATIFTEADGKEAESYPAGDAEAAHRAGTAQMRVYEDWLARGSARRWRDGPARPGVLSLGILIEGADPVREPAELAWWAERGVVAVGLAWWKDSRYAAGNGCTDPSRGLTDLGERLVDEIDRLGLVHDASHLADRSLRDLAARSSGRIIASHSNSRVLMGDPANQRHLSDEQIRLIAGRGGVIGLNLFGRFLRPGAGESVRATIADALDHVEHVSRVAGGRRFVGLGSDADGGFSALGLPEGLERPSDWARLAEGLSGRGWSDGEIEGFCWDNWARFFGLSGRTT